MAIANTQEYTVTGADIKNPVATVVTFNIGTGKALISGEYLINSFVAGQVTVQYDATPEGGSATGLTSATLTGANVSTNGHTLQAKNRAIKKHMTWEFHKDILPFKFEALSLKITWTDGGSNDQVETITHGVLDTRRTIINLKNTNFGTDTTPLIEFAHPKTLKELRAKPVLEYGTTENFSVIDHTITAFEYYDGSAWQNGDASTGEIVLTTEPLKMRMTATTAMAGTEFYRVRLVPVSFT